MDGEHIIPADLPLSAGEPQREETRKVVRAMMALTGMSASGLARAAGLTASTLNRFMNKPVAHTLSQRTMLALMTATLAYIKDRPLAVLDAAALAILAPAAALYEPAIASDAPALKPLLGEIRARMLPAAAPLTDLPVVMARSQGIDVAAADFARAPLRTARPPFLESDPRAFALLMPDASMSPRFDVGDMLYVSPAQELAEGLDVVIDKAGVMSVATCVQLSTATLKLAKLNPKSRTSVERDTLRGVYAIVGLQRLGRG